MFSCQNDDQLIRPNDQASIKIKGDLENSQVTEKLPSQPEPYTIWHDISPTVYGCWTDGGNCLKEVVVGRNTFATLSDLVTSINNTSNTVFFTNNKNLMLTIIDQANYDMVMKGDLTVRAKGPLNNTAYLLFKNVATQQLEFVAPLK